MLLLRKIHSIQQQQSLLLLPYKQQQRFYHPTTPTLSFPRRSNLLSSTSVAAPSFLRQQHQQRCLHLSSSQFYPRSPSTRSLLLKVKRLSSSLLLSPSSLLSLSNLISVVSRSNIKQFICSKLPKRIMIVPPPSSSSSWSSCLLFVSALSLFVISEVIFYILYKFVFIPRCSEPTPTIKYRDYDNKNRVELMKRIMNRIKRTAQYRNEPYRDNFSKFLQSWFVIEEDQQQQQVPKKSLKNMISSMMILQKQLTATTANTLTSLTTTTVKTNDDDDDEETTISSSISNTSKILQKQITKQITSVTAATTTDDEETTSNSSSVVSNTSTNEASSEVEEEEEEEVTKPLSSAATFADISKDQINSFFSWAFFNKHYEQLDEWEVKELQQMFKVLEIEHDMVFKNNNNATAKDDDTTDDDSTNDNNDNNNIKPMRLTIDSINPKYRPLIVYILFYFLKQIGFVVLQMNGFQRYTSSNGRLKYWYRDGDINNNDVVVVEGHEEEKKKNKQDDLLPILFFHGIAPGSLALYLPMLLVGLSCPEEENNDDDNDEKSSSYQETTRRRSSSKRRRRPMYMFENPSITFHVSFTPNNYVCNERDTIQGVSEAINKHTPSSQNLSVVAHSFGTCQLTWLMNATADAEPELKKKIKQITLLDPVSILLHESDVITNFLYSSCNKMKSKSSTTTRIDNKEQECTGGDIVDDDTPETKEPYDRIGIVVHELFIEHYLRRHFAWYNSDLWLEDLFPSSSSSSSKGEETRKTKVVVGLSDHDEILNSSKIVDEIQLFNNNNNNNNNNNQIDLIEWKSNNSNDSSKKEHCGHGYCISNANTWKQINNVITKHEKEILGPLPTNTNSNDSKKNV